MTREEALSKAINIIVYFEAHFAKSKEAREEVENIIEALEQEPCEDWYDVPSNEMTLEQARQAVTDLRKKLAEHLEQESKTGHWIRWYEQKEYDGYTENIPHCKCSECNREYDPYIASLFNYCPNCGARTIDEQERSGEE